MPPEMAAMSACTMLQFRAFSNIFRTPVLFCKKDDKLTSVLLKLNKPKRPPNPFIKFMADCREDLQAKYPDKNFRDIPKICSKMWKDMPEKDKTKYNLEFAMKMEEFKNQKHNFLKQLKSSEAKEAWNNASKKITAADMKILGKPQPPRMNFILFCSFLKKYSPDLSYKELIKDAKAKWKSGDTVWKNFEEEISKFKMKYEGELLKWEEKMYKKGYLQLVRPETLELFRKSE